MKQSTFINLISAIYAILFINAVENAAVKRDTSEGKSMINYFYSSMIIISISL